MAERSLATKVSIGTDAYSTKMYNKLFWKVVLL